MTEKEIIAKYILDKKETEYVDFKEKYYELNAVKSLVTDITSFANNVSNIDKYIIFGVKDDTFDVVGIDSSSLPDISNIEYTLDEYLEPFLNVELNSIEYENKTIGYIKICKKNTNRPYMIKKNKNGLYSGQIYIRKGATNCKANRIDYDAIIRSNKEMQVSIYENELFIHEINALNLCTFGEIKIQIKNEYDNPILINSGYLIIENRYDKITKPIYNFSKLPRLDESPLEILPKSNKIYPLLFDMPSSNIMILRILEDGECFLDTYAFVLFKDTDSKEYESEKIQVTLFAKGDVLHKVKRFLASQVTYLKDNLKKIVKSIEELNIDLFERLICKYDFTFLTCENYYYLIFNRFEYQAVQQIINSSYNVNPNLFIPILLKYKLDNKLIDYIRNYEKETE